MTPLTKTLFNSKFFVADLKASTSEPSKDSLVGVQPKKLTWASIASQPAKPQVTVQNSGLKKKGPGMPPGRCLVFFILFHKNQNVFFKNILNVFIMTDVHIHFIGLGPMYDNNA